MQIPYIGYKHHFVPETTEFPSYLISSINQEVYGHLTFLLRPLTIRFPRGNKLIITLICIQKYGMNRKAILIMRNF